MISISYLFLCLIFSTGLGSLSALVCPNNWTRLGTDCYLFFEEKVTYNEADLRCRIMGTHLLKIRDRQQNQLVTEWLNGRIGMRTDVWLGAKRTFRQGGLDHWIWSDFEDIQYFNWAPEQPNFNGKQFCIEMVRDYNDVKYKWKAGTWNDMTCTEFNAFVCHLRAYNPLYPPEEFVGTRLRTDRATGQLTFTKELHLFETTILVILVSLVLIAGCLIISGVLWCYFKFDVKHCKIIKELKKIRWVYQPWPIQVEKLNQTDRIQNDYA